MDRSSRKRLEEALREFASSRHIEPPANTQARGADDLRAYLDVAAALRNDAVGSPSAGAMDRGRERLLSALHQQRGARGDLPSRYAFARVAAAVAGCALLFGGLAGASAAAGGPNIAQPVLGLVGINHAPDQASTGKEHANPNAFQGSQNAGQGIENASPKGLEHANQHAQDNANHQGGAAGTGDDNAPANAGHGSGGHQGAGSSVPEPTPHPTPSPAPGPHAPTPAAGNSGAHTPVPGRP